jgi:hypothetical protein
VNLAEPVRRLGQELVRLGEAARARCRSAEVEATHRREPAVSRPVDGLLHRAEEFLCLGDPALIGHDLADIAHGHRDARDVADAFEESAAALVGVERARPLPVVVGLDA